MRCKKLVILFILRVLTRCLANSCEEKLSNCTAEMQPVLNESRYMFPTTHREVEGMCKIWSHIMDCIRKYMSDCATEDQKAKFNEAVSDSVDSVHAICSSDRYRRDYLEHAHCLKKVSTESCGVHFRRMVDSAYNPMSMESHICCAYSRYEKCVSEPIQRLCGPQTLHMLDHSMSSLKSRCEVITQKMKSNGKSCQLPDSPPPPPLINAISAPRKSPRTDEETIGSLSSPELPFSNPNFYTTPPWTPRTVIYPMPVTRYSSRISRSGTSPTVPTPPTLAIIGFLLLPFLNYFTDNVSSFG